MTSHVVFGTIAAAVWLFLSGAIIFAGLLPKWWAEHFGQILRDPKTLPIWAVALEKLGQGFALALLVDWTTRPAVKIVVIPLLLVSATYLFLTYANYKVEGKATVLVALTDAVRMIGAVVIVSLIFGRALF